MVSQIDTASKEQALGIGQINDAIVNMEDMTQLNAALVEESSSAGMTMKSQVEEMEKAIRFFQVKA